MEINNFFNEYQIKHFYQEATEKISYVIKSIFLTIHDDRQKLTRSSLAQGRRFDNTIAYEKSSFEFASIMKESVSVMDPK